MVEFLCTTEAGVSLNGSLYLTDQQPPRLDQAPSGTLTPSTYRQGKSQGKSHGKSYN